ncbi:DUF1707 domain-containing protein [Rhodococcus oryzae]|uniref:DUF1707 SHOCT-like domain-containing protein n=1 Tax=Rhodococcus oryzae TaxID=2571143 RepID=UPI003710799F
MSDLSSATTRARDLDRSQTCTLLDAAYSVGQLGVDEYEARTATAMHAATIGDLSSLTADDVDRIGQLIADAPRMVGLPSGRIDRVGIHASDTEPRVTVYVKEGDAYKGWVTATLRGEIRGVQAA